MTYQHIEVKQIAGALGAEVRGVDLSQDIGNAVFSEIQQALHENLVIFFRDQDITPQQHEDFGRRFGPIDAFPFLDYVHAGEGDDLEHPKIAKITTRAKDLPVTNTWHTDVTYMEKPSLG